MLKVRSSVSERMDQLDLDGSELNEVLEGLSIINRFLGNTGSTFRAVKKELKAHPNRKFRIIDLGCGSGDNLRKIAKWCTENQRNDELIGIDGNSNILNYARSKNSDSLEINYFQADILNPDFQLEKCDILMSSHFMYHFTDENLIQFLKKANNQVSHRIIFSDLYRSRIAYFLFKYGGFLIPLHKTVKQDGLKAIARSFKKKELLDIINKSGFTSFTLRNKWAFRYLLTIHTY